MSGWQLVYWYLEIWRRYIDDFWQVFERLGADIRLSRVREVLISDRDKVTVELSKRAFPFHNGGIVLFIPNGPSAEDKAQVHADLLQPLGQIGCLFGGVADLFAQRAGWFLHRERMKDKSKVAVDEMCPFSLDSTWDRDVQWSRHAGPSLKEKYVEGRKR
jgi:hypothetical protein